MKVEVKVIPNAKKRALNRDGAGITVRLTSQPLEGRANDELIRYLSDLLKVRKSGIKIVRGEKDRRKVVEIPMDEEEFNVVLESVDGKQLIIENKILACPGAAGQSGQEKTLERSTSSNSLPFTVHCSLSAPYPVGLQKSEQLQQVNLLDNKMVNSLYYLSSKEGGFC